MTNRVASPRGFFALSGFIDGNVALVLPEPPEDGGGPARYAAAESAGVSRLEGCSSRSSCSG